MICCGIDAGSRAMKVVLTDAASRRVIASAWADQRPDQKGLARDLLERALGTRKHRASVIARTVATGYGRQLLVRADTTATEITCQAVGVKSLVPDVKTIVDIGGQDSKIIYLDGRGVRDFAMNDRCAAGTGQFLEMAAGRLGLPLLELGTDAARSRTPVPITSMCAVFAETEIVSLLASGIRREDVAAGLLRSITLRIASLGTRGMEDPVVFTGGTALIPGLARVLEEALGMAVTIPPKPHLTAALGAALLACDLIASRPAGSPPAPPFRSG